MFNHAYLFNTVKGITLPIDSRWMADIDTNFPTIMDSCRTDAYHLPNQILFVLRLPVVSTMRLNGYKLLPYPARLANSSYYYIESIEQILWVDDLRTTYMLPSSLSSCKQIIRGLFLCTFPSLHRDSSKVCEIQLLSRNAEYCSLQIATFSASVYHQVTENRWIFLVSKDDTLLLRDHTGATLHHTLPRSGILTLPPAVVASPVIPYFTLELSTKPTSTTHSTFQT